MQGVKSPALIMRNFIESEGLCCSQFDCLGDVWHLWTPDNYDLLFENAEAYKKGISIVGVCARLFPRVKVITFELMSNHIHFVLAGRERDIKAFFAYLKSLLSRAFDKKLGEWECQYRKIENLKDARAVIVYNNRNGYIVSDCHSPFSYPWGANRFYFNPEAKARYRAVCRPVTFREKRELCRGHKADEVTGLMMVDDYASPMSFCDIEAGERLFRGGPHYYYELSRNVESQKSIAQEIGERIFYTDDELFKDVFTRSKDKYGISRPSGLPKDAKMEMARHLHYEYNAGNKQIHRMLGLDLAVIDSLFPKAQ